jgi:hypothetical protein
MSRELIISEPGSVAVCGIRSHNGFIITVPGFKFRYTRASETLHKLGSGEPFTESLLYPRITDIDRLRAAVVAGEINQAHA